MRTGVPTQTARGRPAIWSSAPRPVRRWRAGPRAAILRTIPGPADASRRMASAPRPRPETSTGAAWRRADTVGCPHAVPVHDWFACLADEPTDTEFPMTLTAETRW